MEILSATDLLITDQRMLSQLKFKQFNHLESSFRPLKVSAVSSAATDVDQNFSSSCRYVHRNLDSINPCQNDYCAIGRNANQRSLTVLPKTMLQKHSDGFI